MTFTPVLKDYIWGGRNLEKLGRELPDEIIAESWEIAAHEDGTTAVANGYYTGKRLTEVHTDLGLDLIGTNCAWAQERGKFPLLIKLLDANRALSVQVHPPDDYALAHEGNELGKTEMWLVLAAKPGAQVQLGVKAGTTPELFRQGILNGRLEPYLHYVPVQPGDHICVPAGTLHAIMDGILMAEIQQNSNTTYRVYDWNRVGADGKARPLHIHKALDVINFAQVEPTLHPATHISDEGGIRRSLLCRNEYFVTERVEMAAGAIFEGNCDGRTLEIWGVLRGEVVVNGVGVTADATSVTAVQFVLLPAAMGQFTLSALTSSTLLRTYVTAV
jgi:mannose-6-phosphate isomerase